jgi:hypothetical protein
MSGPVLEEIALEEALVLALTQISSYFEDALTTLARPGIRTPVPDPQNYYLGISIAQVERIMTNANVAVFAFPASPPDEIEPNSGASTTSQVLQIVYVQILVAYRLGLYESIELFGKKLAASDVMSLRGFRYNAAINRIMRTKMLNGAGIIGIDGSDILPGETRLTEEGEPLIGFASTLWGFKQIVTRTQGCQE